MTQIEQFLKQDLHRTEKLQLMNMGQLASDVAQTEADLNTLKQCRRILVKEAGEVTAQNDELFKKVQGMKRALVLE